MGGLAALEARLEMTVVTKRMDPLGADAVRTLCAVLRRPLVARGLENLNLRCVHTHLIH